MGDLQPQMFRLLLSIISQDKFPSDHCVKLYTFIQSDFFHKIQYMAII